MSELLDDDENKILVVEDEEVFVDDVIPDRRQRPASDARRRLENLLDERRLRNELEDFLDY